MISLTPEHRQAVIEAGESPVRIEDPATRTAYLLVREDVYRRLAQEIRYDDGPWSQAEQDALLQDFGKRAGWNDPAMDVYDDVPPAQP
jgi:hypothetical protein